MNELKVRETYEFSKISTTVEKSTLTLITGYKEDHKTIFNEISKHISTINVVIQQSLTKESIKTIINTYTSIGKIPCIRILDTDNIEYYNLILDIIKEINKPVIILSEIVNVLEQSKPISMRDKVLSSSKSILIDNIFKYDDCKFTCYKRKRV